MEYEVWGGSGITMNLKWIRFSTIILNTFYMSCCCENVKAMTRRDLITCLIDTEQMPIPYCLTCRQYLFI